MEPCQRFKNKMTGFQNESEMYISLILIKEISNLEWLISLIVGAKRCGGIGCMQKGLQYNQLSRLIDV